MKTVTINQKDRLSGKGIICPNCGQIPSGLDHCEWCGSTLLKGSEPIRLNAETLAAKEDAKIKAQEALQLVLAEQNTQREKVCSYRGYH